MRASRARTRTRTRARRTPPSTPCWALSLTLALTLVLTLALTLVLTLALTLTLAPTLALTRWRAWVVRHVSTLRRAVEARRKKAEQRVELRARSDAAAMAAKRLTSWARCLFVRREHQQKVAAGKT